MSEKLSKSQEDLNTSNIFDEFDVDNESLENKEINKKDIYDYIGIIGNIFKYINFLLFFIIFIAGVYIYIQKSSNEVFKDKSYLNPICNILVGNIDLYKLGINNCSNLYFVDKKLDFLLENTQKKFLKDISIILSKKYEINNNLVSEKVLFLLDKSINKNNPLKILSDFDLLKNEFTGIETSKIDCRKININKNNLKLKCLAYSRDWDSKIPGLNGEHSINTFEGTSISLASSFINFIDNSKNFKNISKQKTFNSTSYLGEGFYTKQTNFNLDLKYNGNSSNLNY